MNSKDANKQGNDPRMEGSTPQRRQEGKEGAGAHHDGPGSQEAGQANRRAKGETENGSGQDNQSENRSQGQNQHAGGDRSGHAARSGATGEQNPEGAANKPEPKDQDEKGLGHPRNR